MLLTNLSVLSFQRSLQNNLTFHAPLTTSIIPIKGTLDGFSRASTAYVEDHEGMLQLVKSGEARFWGARRVENISTGITTQGAATMTDNLDNTITVTNTGTSTANSALIQMTSMGSSYNKSYLVSVKLKASGEHIGKTVRMNVMRNAGTSAASSTDITVTGDWVRYACDVKTMDGATDTGLKVYLFGTAAGTDFDVKEFQVEDVTGQANQNPSEYVAVGAQWDANILSGNNTNFTTGLGDWYNPEPARGTISHDTNRIKIVSDGTGGYAKAAYVYPFKKGRIYAVRATATVTAGTAGIGMSTSAWVSQGTVSGSSGVLTGTFAPTSDYDYLLIFMNSGVADGRYATFDDICVSEITHGTNVDGVKYFDTENGNTVASNVVTEATGAALATIKGYFAEYSRTNLALYSEDFTNAAWTATDATVTGNTVVAPNGYTTADTIAATAGNATVLQTVTAASGDRAFSIYLKRKTGTGNIDITQDGGATWTTVTINSSTWTRGVKYQAAVTNPQFGIRIVTSGDEVYAWGAQLEVGTFKSSYIPTTTASVARSADLLAYATPHSTFNTTASVYAETTPTHAYGDINLTTWRGRILGAGVASNAFVNYNNINKWLEMYDGTGTASTAGNSWQWVANTTYKVASSWGASFMRCAVSGTASSNAAFDNDMNGAAATFRVGTTNAEGQCSYAGVGNVKIWKKAYTGARLAVLTT